MAPFPLKVCFTDITQASQGIQEVNQNVNQSSIVAAEITKDIAVVNHSSGELATSSEQVKVSSDGLKHMAAELNKVVITLKYRGIECESGTDSVCG